MCTTPNIRRKDVLSSALPRICARVVFALVLGFTSLFSAQQLRAQSDDSQNGQDVAEAARQERARKQKQSAKHVYMNEDLHRGKILTPEDQLRAEAKRKQSAPPATQQNAEPLDANSNTPQEPLGDVARRYRNAQRDSQKTSPFHLPSQHPELAAPKILAPVPEPALKLAPKNFVATKPSVPFNRAPIVSSPSFPSNHPTRRVDPFLRPRIQPAPPTAVVRPVEPRIAERRNFAAPSWAPVSRPRLSSPPSAQTVIVREGDTLWTLSRQHLGRGTRWLELMAANPTIADPTRLVPGTSLTLPPRITMHHAKAQTITVQAGDSLSKIALSTYGHATAWPCIAQANPTLSSPHRLSIGQTLSLPPSCTP